MPPSDEQCVRFCLDGQPAAFRQLVARHQAALLRDSRGRLPNHGDAEEAAQEAFVRAYFMLPKLRTLEAFPAWLFGIADRVAKEAQRAAKRCRPPAWEPIHLDALPAKREADRDSTVVEAVAGLPENYREVILLRYFEGRSCAEISADLGVPLGTVTKRLSRAYTLLREKLGASADRESEVLP